MKHICLSMYMSCTCNAWAMRYMQDICLQRLNFRKKKVWIFNFFFFNLATLASVLAVEHIKFKYIIQINFFIINNYVNCSTGHNSSYIFKWSLLTWHCLALLARPGIIPGFYWVELRHWSLVQPWYSKWLIINSMVHNHNFFRQIPLKLSVQKQLLDKESCTSYTNIFRENVLYLKKCYEWHFAVSQTLFEK